VQGSYNLSVNYNINSDALFAPRLFGARQDAAEADVTFGAELLRSTVTQQYIAVLQAKARAALQDTLQATSKGLLDLAKARQAVGAATILEVRRAEVTLGRRASTSPRFVSRSTACSNSRAPSIRPSTRSGPTSGRQGST
jgi:outer membrane protein TolC